MDLGLDIISDFACKTATINLVAIAKFFDITYKAILLSLFASKHHNSSLLGPISTYFEIVKTNSRDIFYLHCLV